MSETDLEGVVIWIEPAVLDRIRKEALQASPQECCGILLGPAQNNAGLAADSADVGGAGAQPPVSGGIHITAIMPAANIAEDPVKLFEIDPQVLFSAYRAERKGELSVVGFYHSHPRGEPVPSATDQAMAPRDGKVWLIAGAQAVACWRDDHAGFSPLPYSLTQR